MLRKIIIVMLVPLALLWYKMLASSPEKSEYSYEILWPAKNKKLCLKKWYQSGHGKVIVIYMGREDFEDLQPWLDYWERQANVNAVLLVDYGEEARPLWQSLPESTAYDKTVAIKRFDGSIFRVMPPGFLPAAYVIAAGEYAQGPFESYADLPLSIGVLEA